MALTITSFRNDARVTPAGNMWRQDVPYRIVNITFRIDQSTADGSWEWQRAKAEATEYSSVLTIDDPQRYEQFLLSADWHTKYDGYGRAWTHNDAPWQYIEKFDTFWYREWVADSLVTRMMLWEIEHYTENGKLPSVYRHAESCIILQHMRALHGYWD